MQCRICGGDFRNSPDGVILCDCKEGAVHLGCCINSCSWDKKPCGNSQGFYEKINQ